MFDVRILSSLEKVFCDEEPKASVLHSGSALRGEVYSFQIAFMSDIQTPQLKVDFTGPLAKYATLFRIGNVHAEQLGGAAKPGSESLGYLRVKPGLFPDVLYTDLDKIHACPYVWYSVWCRISIPEHCKAGDYPFEITVNPDGNPDSNPPAEKQTFTLHVSDAVLPAQTLRHTEWFYCDCIAQAHCLKPWSAPFWKILEAYFRDFASHGINLLLTPVFTIPLDTLPGRERLTTQLIGVEKHGKGYTFDFRKFRRWVRLAQKCGITHFEISHLFTQWGAWNAPKIVATVNGKEKKIFGWDTDAHGPEYETFLDTFLQELVKEIDKLGIHDNVYFHTSDEPSDTVLDSYMKASAVMKRNLPGFKLMDAASHEDFYSKGLIALPVPGEAALENFMKFDIPERWTYYCCGPTMPYSNRLHTMPASANRIIGTLLYLYQCDGFLHWGYNFWNSGRSRNPVDPLGLNPDFEYPSGDQCLVYPGPEGPLDSMRYEVFTAGLQDMRALQALEKRIGREKTVALIHECAGMEIKMSAFPLDREFLPKLRERVNALLECKK